MKEQGNRDRGSYTTTLAPLLIRPIIGCVRVQPRHGSGTTVWTTRTGSRLLVVA